MNNNSRTKNSVLNIIATTGYQILLILGNFILRTIFIKNLSAEYLGINGLFSNILSVLSLAELGVGSAIIYSMYKPLKENDREKLAGLITYYKKIYSRIGIIVLVVGLMIVPFLPMILNLENDIPHITFYYLLYLANSVTSYYMVYKTTIVRADQKEYYLRKYEIIFTIIRMVLQLLALILLKSYTMYLIIQIMISIASNYYMSKRAEKMYPYIINNVDINESEKKSIWNNIKSLFLYQIGGVALNNTDNIIISIIVGTITVGLYSNYSMIITALATFTSLIFTAIISSIGNYNIESSAEGKKFIFDVLEMMSFWIYGFCSICLMILMQSFISLWVGHEYVLDNSTLLIIVINYYITGIIYPVFCFRNTTNLFKTTKYIMLIAAIINIILSIVLGRIWGLNGILIATAIARVTTNVWYEPYILFRDYFKSNVIKYYFKKIIECLAIVIIYYTTFIICQYININNKILEFILKAGICAIVPNVIYIIMLYKRKEFKFILEKITVKLKK